MSFLLKNITKDTLNDISQYLLTKSDEIIKNIYDKYFENLKNEIKKDLDKQFDSIK